MQLFQLARNELKYVAHDIVNIKALQKEGASPVLHDIIVPLHEFGSEHLEPHSSQPSTVRLSLFASNTDGINHERVNEGIKDFVYSAMEYAVNPLTPEGMELDDPNISVEELGLRDHKPVEDGAVEDPELGGEDEEMEEGIVFPFICFKTINVDTFTVAPLGLELDNLETTMFADWKEQKSNDLARPGIELSTKTFRSDDECRRIEHLFCCMAQAANIGDERIAAAFYPVKDKSTLVLDKVFLIKMMEFEKSEVADFAGEQLYEGNTGPIRRAR